jgi:hypothetical protein
MMPADARPERVQLTRAARLLTRARDAFYERRYEEAIEHCQETLATLLPRAAERPHGEPPLSPDDQADLFLGAFAGSLPLVEAERIAGVFTFFVRRKAQFRYERGRPLPRREWWEFLQISREEASEVLTATRHALEAVQRAGAGQP